MAKLTYDEKLFLGERGSLLAGRRNFEAFYSFADEARVSPKTLEFLARAYEEGGVSGINAIEPGGRLSRSVLSKALPVVEEFLRERFPGKRYSLRTRGRAISVELHANCASSSARLRFQLRHTPHDGKWHLYWRRNNGRWWPHYGGSRVNSLQGCLREVGNDTFGCFWT
jgi:hypothetical protein